MVSVLRFIGAIARFGRSGSGATAVEFAILLPVMLVTFGAIVEGSRIYWNYQAAVSGVRDASRYLARITDNDVCVGGPGIITDGVDEVIRVVTSHLDVDGAGLFPAAVTLSTAIPPTATYTCINVTNVGIVPVAVVTATVDVQLPLAALFSFFGTPNGQMVSTITDQSRIYGL